MKKVQVELTEEQFIKILKDIRKDKHKMAFILGFYQGMRISEILALKPEHCDFKQRIIRIKEGKGAKDRHIPIMPEVMKPLKKYIDLLPLVHGYRTHPSGVRSLEYLFKDKVRKFNLNPELHFHSLRHSCATRLINEKKWDVRQVQPFLGHSNLNTTAVYTHVRPTDLIKLAWEGK